MYVLQLGFDSNIFCRAACFLSISRKRNRELGPFCRRSRYCIAVLNGFIAAFATSSVTNEHGEAAEKNEGI